MMSVSLSLKHPQSESGTCASDAGFRLFNDAVESFMAQLPHADLQRRFSVLANFINTYTQVRASLEQATEALHVLSQSRMRVDAELSLARKDSRVELKDKTKAEGGDSDSDSDGEDVAKSIEAQGDAAVSAAAVKDACSVREAAPQILMAILSILQSWTTMCEAHVGGTSFPSPHVLSSKLGPSPGAVACNVACGLMSMIFEKPRGAASADAGYDAWKALLDPVFKARGSEAKPLQSAATEDPQVECDPMERVRSELQGRDAAAFELTDAKTRANCLELRAMVTSRALRRSLSIEEGKRMELQRLVLREVLGTWRFRVMVDKHLRGQHDEREATIERLTATNDDKTKQIKRLQDRLQEIMKAFDRESHDLRKKIEVERENNNAHSKKIRELMENIERQVEKHAEAQARIMFLSAENERFQEKLRVYFHASRGDALAMEEVRRIAVRNGSNNVDAADDDVRHVKKSGLLNFVPSPPPVKVTRTIEADEEADAANSSVVADLLELVQDLALALAPVPRAAYTGGEDGNLEFSDFSELLSYVAANMKATVATVDGNMTPTLPPARSPSGDDTGSTFSTLRPASGPGTAARRSQQPSPDSLRPGIAVTPIPGAATGGGGGGSSHRSSLGFALPAPELQVPLWVQLLASTTVVTAPNSFDMAVHLLGSTTGQTTRRRSQQQTGSVSSQRGSLFSTCSSPTQSLPVLLRNTSGRFSIDTVLDVASLIGRELAVVPDVTDFCDPRPEPKRVANARKMIREALDRAKAMETIRGQFVADLIVEERRSRPEKVPTTFVLRH